VGYASYTLTYLKPALLIFTYSVFGLSLLSCATSPDADSMGAVTDDSISITTQPLPNSEYSSRQSDFIDQSQDSAESTAIQGDLEFLNLAEGEPFDVNEFRRLVEAEELPSGIILNFEGADIKRVISLVIGKIMRENYLIDPAVKGTVTLKTEKPLNRDTVFYMLENVLDLYDARISKRKGHYRIFPKEKPGLSMLGFGDIDTRTKLGYGYRIVPLEYVSSGEMVKILESVTNEETIIRADDARNLLILGGTSENVKNMLNAIEMFDVDWMKGTNVGLIKVNYSKVNDVLDDLKKMIAINQDTVESGGILNLDAIERLNSILVITRQYTYLQRVMEWARKLDIPAQGAGSNLYVYQVKNSTAEELAGLLSELFDTGNDVGIDDATLGGEEDITGPGSVPITIGAADSTEAQPVHAKEDNSVEPSPRADIEIIAASDSNSLLISATPNEYSKIELALEMLDIPPLQVLMEVTIMDVQLTGNMSYGIQWFVDHGDANDGGSAIIGDALTFPQTFSYAGVRSGGDLRVILGLLASDGKVKVLSSPSVLVRNNHRAAIRVGDQQPISQASVNENGTVIATSVEYRDTGILLEIKPSITSSGTVNVELTQEVIDVGDIDTATGQRTFLNRNLNTSVSVDNGETIILGGLIRTNSAVSKSGIPGLRDVPGIGFLFGKTVTSDVRTELVIMLSPRIIRNPDENNAVMQEYKAKFQNAEF
jgi:general secretion pathway protein D